MRLCDMFAIKYKMVHNPHINENDQKINANNGSSPGARQQKNYYRLPGLCFRPFAGARGGGVPVRCEVPYHELERVGHVRPCACSMPAY